MDILILLAMGALAGILAGLLGIGGGIIIVPVLVLVFEQQGIGDAVIMHVAIGTSLATIVVTSLFSIRAHHRHGAVDWSVMGKMTPGIILGSLLGATLAKQIDGMTLRYLFIGFMLLVAVQMARGAALKPHRTLPGALVLNLAGLIIGKVSALMGIGGGTMSVPFLTWCNTPVRRAIATSAAIGFPIALAAAAGYLYHGLDVAGRPSWMLGYINLPAFFGIVTASIFFAPYGARLAHRMPELTLKRFFALFLFVMALYLALK